MKIAVSIPDPVFANAERLAAQLKTSRSRLYALALDEFIGRHSDATLTQAMNEAIDIAGQESASSATAPAVRRTMLATEW